MKLSVAQDREFSGLQVRPCFELTPMAPGMQQGPRNEIRGSRYFADQAAGACEQAPARIEALATKCVRLSIGSDTKC